MVYMLGAVVVGELRDRPRYNTGHANLLEFKDAACACRLDKDRTVIKDGGKDPLYG